MLVISRRIGETIQIGNDITLQITSINGNQVKLAIEAPRDIPILRDDAKKHYQDGQSPVDK